MNALGVCETMQQKLIEGVSITQGYQFAKYGKPEPGFVRLSWLTHGETTSRRLVPQETYDPLRQHAVLLKAGSKGRRAPVDFLKGPETHAGIARHVSVRQAWS